MQSSTDKVNEQLQKLAELLQDYPLGSVEYQQAWIARQAILYALAPERWTAPTECINRLAG